METTNDERMKLLKRTARVKAFTIFELTVVLALLSVIVTIISWSLNRFNEQIKNSSVIHTELNQWFAFRSNLWHELYNADSLVCGAQSVSIFKGGTSIDYRVAGETLERRNQYEWGATAMEIESINREVLPDGILVHFNFKWKGELMELSFKQFSQVKEIINHYFETSDG